jgi:hypothetical protein
VEIDPRLWYVNMYGSVMNLFIYFCLGRLGGGGGGGGFMMFPPSSKKVHNRTTLLTQGCPHFIYIGNPKGRHPIV